MREIYELGKSETPIGKGERIDAWVQGVISSGAGEKTVDADGLVTLTTLIFEISRT